MVTNAQSFEVMSGTSYIFTDAQYLKFFDEDQKFSLFSRARATFEYGENATNLFMGGYMNYTTKSGFGGTVVGRIATNSAGVDAGIHYFKAVKSVIVYALPSINLSDSLLYSWFSIVRYTPDLKNGWKLYTSLEIFSAFGKIGHLNSVQRLRFGVDKREYQFGASINFNESSYADTEVNTGVFFRKQF